MNIIQKIIEFFKSLFSKKSHNIETENYTIEQDSLEIPETEWEDAIKEQIPDTTDDTIIVVNEEPKQETVYSKPLEPKYFTISELCKSSTATIKKIDNTPTEEVKKNLTELIVYLLDPIREAWAEYCTKQGWTTKGITVTSGYRCPALNKAVGGVTTSAHLCGFAADTKPSNGKQSAYEQFIKEWASKNKDVKFDQIIIEKSSISRWVHIGIKLCSTGKQRMQIFNLNV